MIQSVLQGKEDQKGFSVYDPNGENELKQTANYEAYKLKVDNPIPRLRYWRTVMSDLSDVMKEEILPLQRE